MAAANSTNNNMPHVEVDAESNREGSRDSRSRRVANNSKRDDAVAGFARGGGGERIQRRQVAAVRKVEYVAEEDINQEADAFIRRFREELHLQRLQSIENYNQMLARGL